MKLLDFRDPVIEKAFGYYVADSSGKKYLDFASGQLCSVLGHSHPRLVKTIRDQSGESIHLGSRFLSDRAVEAAAKFSSITPKKISSFVFLSTGAEANEFALRLARAYNSKPCVVGLDRGYYGSSYYLGQLSFAGDKSGLIPSADGILKITSPYCFRCPLKLNYPSCKLDCIKRDGERLSSCVGEISSFIVEPVLSAGGMIVPPKGYFKKLGEIARRQEALIISDEAQTGFGRTGRWWGFTHWDGVTPDIIVSSKGCGGGYPASAVATTKEIEKKTLKKGFSHISSHMNDPLGCAVISTVIDVIKEEKLVENSRDAGDYLKKRLNELKESSGAVIGDVRGLGLMLGMEVVDERGEPNLKAAQGIESECLKRGLILGYGSFSGVFRICPPLNITCKEIDAALSVLEDSIKKRAST